MFYQINIVFLPQFAFWNKFVHIIVKIGQINLTTCELILKAFWNSQEINLTLYYMS